MDLTSDESVGRAPSGEGAVPASQPMPYPGKEPSNVSKDAKYTCGLDRRVRLLYDLGNREETLLTTDAHPQLVDMVRAVKDHFGESPAGVFYINEYGHVLVKASGKTWYAGRYGSFLEFEFEGHVIGPVPDPALKPGDPWTGPHVGINYTLSANGNDIYYKHATRPGVVRKELLSDFVDPATITRIARSVKNQGGRLYINEARALFTPVTAGRTLSYVYLGAVETHQWFPEPKVG